MSRFRELLSAATKRAKLNNERPQRSSLASWTTASMRSTRSPLVLTFSVNLPLYGADTSLMSINCDSGPWNMEMCDEIAPKYLSTSYWNRTVNYLKAKVLGLGALRAVE
jgi:hypothetical protein